MVLCMRRNPASVGVEGVPTVNGRADLLVPLRFSVRPGERPQLRSQGGGQPVAVAQRAGGHAAAQG